MFSSDTAHYSDRLCSNEATLKQLYYRDPTTKPIPIVCWNSICQNNVCLPFLSVSICVVNKISNTETNSLLREMVIL